MEKQPSKIVVLKSTPFIFCESQVVERRDNETWWLDVLYTKDSSGHNLAAIPVTNKFIYVFPSNAARDTPMDSFDLWFELFADANGQLTVRSVSDHASAADADTRNGHLSLPYQIGDERLFYQFVVTRRRIENKMLDKFGAALTARKELTRYYLGMDWDMNIPVDVDGELVRYGPNRSLTYANLPVVDGLTVATALHTAYEMACDSVSRWVNPSKDIPKADDEEGRERRQKILIANLLDKLITANSFDNALGLDGNFGDGDGVGTNVREFLAANVAELNKRIKARDDAAATLCYWLDSALMTALKDVADASFEANSDVMAYSDFLKLRFASESRLCESVPGIRYLRNLGANPDLQYKTFVLPSSSGATKFNVADNLRTWITYAWMQIAPALVSWDAPIISYSEYMQMLGRLAGIRAIAAPTTMNIKMPPKVPNGPQKVVAVKVTALDRETMEKLSTWFSDKGDVASRLRVMAFAFGFVSIAYAGNDLLKADEPIDKLRTLLGLAGAGVTAMGAGLEVLTLAEESAKLLGAFGAMATAASSGISCLKDLTLKDYGSAAGDGLSAVGSGLMALAGISALEGAGASATVVGIPVSIVAWVGAGIALAGSVVVTLFHDTDVVKMVKFSAFGSDPSGTEEKPAWSPVAFDQWNKGEVGMGKQLLAMMTLLGAFTVRPVDRRTVEIFPGGLMGAASQFTMTFREKFSSANRDATAVYDCASQQITVISNISSEPMETATAHTGKATDGRPFILIRFEPPFKSAFHNMQILGTSIDVRFTLDDSITIPRHGPLSCEVWDGSPTVLSGLGVQGEVSSKDVA